MLQVQLIMAEEDSVGCAQRRLRPFIRRSFHSPGPKYSWHADGYDKLKLYTALPYMDV